MLFNLTNYFKLTAKHFPNLAACFLSLSGIIRRNHVPQRLFLILYGYCIKFLIGTKLMYTDNKTVRNPAYHAKLRLLIPARMSIIVLSGTPVILESSIILISSYIKKSIYSLYALTQYNLILL